MKYTAILREKGSNYYVKRVDSDYSSKASYAKDCRANGYYVGGIFTDAEIDLIVNGFNSDDLETWRKSMEFRMKFSERIISCFTDGCPDISEPKETAEPEHEAENAEEQEAEEEHKEECTQETEKAEPKEKPEMQKADTLIDKGLNELENHADVLELLSGYSETLCRNYPKYAFDCFLHRYNFYSVVECIYSNSKEAESQIRKTLVQCRKDIHDGKDLTKCCKIILNRAKQLLNAIRNERLNI